MTQTTPDGDKPAAIILAAGKGTRMKSDLPKVCHPVGGRPMVCAVVDACRAAGCGRIVAVVGYKQELVREALRGYEGVDYAVQAEQLGTGHAVRCAEAGFGTNPKGEVFVLCGDGPLIRAQTLRRVLDRHRSAGARATLATSIVPDPSGYGRITRDASGRFTGIVEQKNATPEQIKIREINPSYYCFEAGALFSALRDVTKNEASGEYYITDVPGVLMARGDRVEVIDAVPPEDVLSINTLEQLAEVDRIFRSRGGRG
ncbi:MAG: NTP transferase domain-containing protein [Phycisphaerales bacterium]|nr:NTP transferase domain-containing protein [Phycisphaerales bacterium]